MSDLVKYLCIDDQNDITVLIGALQKSGSITIDHITPTEFREQHPIIENFLTENQGKDIGLLLDLRLDSDVDAQGNRVTYRGPALAQEIRTRMSENPGLSAPIVLWSINTNFQASYNNDSTSHDLFDAIIDKQTDVAEHAARTASQLISLACGYSTIKKFNSINQASVLMGLIEEADSPLYARFFGELDSILEKKRPSEIAHFILSDLIKQSGLLVTERMLSARLGIDIVQSTGAWEQLLVKLTSTRYNGPFHDGWARWWWYRVENWWRDSVNTEVDIWKLDAAERVDCLNKVLDISLAKAVPIVGSYSTKFSTVCVGLKKPLNPSDGFRVVQNQKRPWHDDLFVSGEAALNRVNQDSWRMDPLENYRFEELKHPSED